MADNNELPGSSGDSILPSPSSLFGLPPSSSVPMDESGNPILDPAILAMTGPGPDGWDPAWNEWLANGGGAGGGELGGLNGDPSTGIGGGSGSGGIINNLDPSNIPVSPGFGAALAQDMSLPGLPSPPPSASLAIVDPTTGLPLNSGSSTATTSSGNITSGFDPTRFTSPSSSASLSQSTAGGVPMTGYYVNNSSSSSSTTTTNNMRPPLPRSSGTTAAAGGGGGGGIPAVAGGRRSGNATAGWSNNTSPATKTVSTKRSASGAPRSTTEHTRRGHVHETKVTPIAPAVSSRAQAGHSTTRPAKHARVKVESSASTSSNPGGGRRRMYDEDEDDIDDVGDVDDIDDDPMSGVTSTGARGGRNAKTSAAGKKGGKKASATSKDEAAAKSREAAKQSRLKREERIHKLENDVKELYGHNLDTRTDIADRQAALKATADILDHLTAVERSALSLSNLFTALSELKAIGFNPLANPHASAGVTLAFILYGLGAWIQSIIHMAKRTPRGDLIPARGSSWLRHPWREPSWYGFGADSLATDPPVAVPGQSMWEAIAADNAATFVMPGRSGPVSAFSNRTTTTTTTTTASSSVVAPHPPSAPTASTAVGGLASAFASTAIPSSSQARGAHAHNVNNAHAVSSTTSNMLTTHATTPPPPATATATASSSSSTAHHAHVSAQGAPSPASSTGSSGGVPAVGLATSPNTATFPWREVNTAIRQLPVETPRSIAVVPSFLSLQANQSGRAEMNPHIDPVGSGTTFSLVVKADAVRDAALPLMSPDAWVELSCTINDLRPIVPIPAHGRGLPNRKPNFAQAQQEQALLRQQEQAQQQQQQQQYQQQQPPS